MIPEGRVRGKVLPSDTSSSNQAGTYKGKEKIMERVTFKSVSQGNVRYVVTKGHYDHNDSNFYSSPGSYVSNTCLQYDTFGDGEVQHTPEYLVPAQQIEDFMVSLALYISDNHSSELFKVLEHLEPHGISEPQIKFLYNLKPNSNGKPTYINLQETKKTTADKQYDKRWEKLDSDWVPTFRNIFRHMSVSFHGFLDRLVVTEKIRQATDYGVWVDYEEEWKITNFSNIRNGMLILESFLTAYRNIDSISRQTESLKYNMKLSD